MKVGLLGGTFDPVHYGHIQLARSALRQLHLDKVYFVLSPRSPFKEKENLTSVPRRLKWLKTALKGQKGFQVGRWELRGRGPSYTFDSLQTYKKKHSQDELFFIMGSDSWKAFPRWKKPDEVARLATLVVGRRPGSTSIRVPIRFKKSVRLLKGVFPNISSTQMRAAVRKGEALWKDLLRL